MAFRWPAARCVSTKHRSARNARARVAVRSAANTAQFERRSKEPRPARGFFARRLCECRRLKHEGQMFAKQMVAAAAAVLLLLSSGGCETQSTREATTDDLTRILAGNQRTEANRARDVYRHPKQTL